MYGSQSSQRRPSGAPGFSVLNHVSQERQHTVVGDIPYNFGSDQSHLSPLTPMTPALPQPDDVFGGPREQTGTSGDATNGLMQNQHNQIGTGQAGQMSSPEFPVHLGCLMNIKHHPILLNCPPMGAWYGLTTGPGFFVVKLKLNPSSCVGKSNLMVKLLLLSSNIFE
ncbi:uncharacterized protein EDB91DRAFT_1081843 [Suillus paluster]|uniref:uncharacterized protein n=1 Tax=Suillus paluster TaxID=48578 RepID=UPI001B883737|nr:uncharacterized protein EDB91DRAFT_1081843 [Suillus paluster]KAG1740745.1 hypothetical protein EDB91DRAFT_1081843 [Suillus paluster]